MHVLVRGNLVTGEREVVDGPREESFFESANQRNYDHYQMVLKHIKGHYEINNEKWVWDKKYIWFDEEYSND